MNDTRNSISLDGHEREKMLGGKAVGHINVMYNIYSANVNVDT